ncbi:creatininase family protein (plasmid) [Deinococcus radiomollis]|uniref:creatininase family protein n=1 Tax=Deinococcus radiomollis TaxID=468916 RepID=UPI0038917AA7
MSLTPSRRWSDLSWQAIRDLPKDPGVVVLPIGAIEQHGPHLPVWTDALLAERMTARAFELLPPDVSALLLPALSYGKSNEHTGYPGTIALSAATLMATLRDIGAAVAKSGFTRLMFFNTHGGNKALLEMMVRDLRAELGLLCFLTSGVADTSGLPEAERRFGIHANTVETSMMLHLTPELVQHPLPAAHYPDFTSTTFNLTTQPQVGWLTRDWSEQGHFGDPSAATPEAGAGWFEESAAALARQITEASSFRVAHG